MARRRNEIDDLAKRIDALPPKDQIRLFDRVLTPEMQFHAVRERLRKKIRRASARDLNRAVDTAVRKVRASRRAS